MKIIVRELAKSDIVLIADYWLNSDQDFLLSMGVDMNKLPSREEFAEMLAHQIRLPYKEKSSLALIAEINGEPLGHCNVNELTFGIEAKMHLHLWNKDYRKKGLGTEMVLQSLPIFFDKLKLKTIWCEPYAENQAPNKTLKNIGFEFVKKYLTVPGSLNFEQEVNRYKLTKEKFEEIKNLNL